MPRFAANLARLFTELPFDNRFAAAARAGFQGVEIPYPYDMSASRLAQLSSDSGLDIVSINTPPPNWAGGPRGFAATPGLEKRFRSDFDRALRISEALRSHQIHVMAGPAEGRHARQTFVENLAWACARAPDMNFNIEVMNQEDYPGYFLTCFDLATDILAEIDSPRIGLNFDTYHAQKIAGDPLSLWQRYSHHIHHIQIAAAPRRHEPNEGAFGFTSFFAELDQAGYQGWITADYDPEHLTAQGLGWLPLS